MSERDDDGDTEQFPHRSRTPPHGTQIRDPLADVRVSLNEIREDIVDIKGKHGNNGKLGELRRQVDGIRGWLRWAVMSAAGALLTSGVLVFKSGLQLGQLEQRLVTAEEKIKDLRWERLRDRQPPASPDPGEP